MTTVDEAMTGLAEAKVSHGGDPLEASIAYLADWLRDHAFSEAEAIDLVWEAAWILDRRGRRVEPTREEEDA